MKRSETGQAGHLYIEAVRLYRTKKPMVGAIHGAAVGGGLGLAMVPDMRVTCPEARFCANFTRLGFHPGFGLTHTLPALIGPSKAAMMFYTSRRIPGDEAVKMGLADVLVPQAEVRAAAQKLAAEIAENSPLGVLETRATMRAGLADRVRAATDHELEVQTRLRKTADFKEGVDAVNERRQAELHRAVGVSRAGISRRTRGTLVNPFAGRDVNWLLDFRAETRGDHPFLIWEPFEGERQIWTYRQFRDRVLRVAAGLARRGIKAGDYVLVHLDNSPEMEFLWFACARLGAVVVTTNTRSAGAELEYFADNCNAVAADHAAGAGRDRRAPTPSASSGWR